MPEKDFQHRPCTRPDDMIVLAVTAVSRGIRHRARRNHQAFMLRKIVRVHQQPDLEIPQTPSMFRLHDRIPPPPRRDRLITLHLHVSFFSCFWQYLVVALGVARQTFGGYFASDRNLMAYWSLTVHRHNIILHGEDRASK